MHILEVEINAEGSKLAYLSPADEKGNPKSGYRIAGPKAWGGSKTLARLKISDADLATYIRQYAKGLIPEITK